MAGRLAEKVAIVVGAGQTPGDGLGNGRAAALLFAREGAAVLAVDRSLESAEETCARIAAEGGRAVACAADVTRDEDCRAMAARCAEAFGRIDVLHNNVGVGSLGGPVELAEAEWDRVLDTNLKAMFLTCKHVLPQMVRQGGGAIVNVSSLAAERFPPFPMLAYAASKAGVHALTRTIAVQYAAQGIRANAVMPGLIDTPMAMEGISTALGIDKETLRRARESAVPMQRMGEAWDVAYAALYLASEESKYVTGIVLPVDGGLACKG